MAETLIAAEKKLKQLSTIVLGSSELLRHTLHCDRERKMKEMYRVTVLPSFNANLVKKVGRSVPKITNEKFNAIFAYYESKSSAPVQ